MRRARPFLIALGVLLTLVGLLWVGQGLGYVRWPRTSSMIDDRSWSEYGSALAVGGLLLILLVRRLR